MLFLTRLLMRSRELASPTIILITDRSDLDSQLSEQFTRAKQFIGDEHVRSVESRADLRESLKGCSSGGVFLTTIQKFSEDTELLSERSNIICISDEAHRSQTNLDQKLRITEQGVKRSWGFARHLHTSLPNATYVGFTGTPVDATLDVFGPIVDAYTMTESVADGITVRIVYEGRAARVVLDNAKLAEIEEYYARCAQEGANENQIEESKKAAARMSVILGDPDRIRAVAEDFVSHYEQRIEEASTVKGKAMFICANREIAFTLWQEIVTLRPEWNEVLACAPDETLSETERRSIKPMERVKMVMTRGKDDPKELYDLLGTSEYRRELDRQFKTAKSNFRIAILVDMWLTGFDVPFLDTLYIDKPLQRHSLIQTISRVNRRYQDKEKGLVVDYFGIKRQMNLALAQFSKSDRENVEEVAQSLVVVRDQLDLLNKLFHGFDLQPYHNGRPLQQLDCLNRAVEYAQITKKREQRFMEIVKRLKAAWAICSASEHVIQGERDQVHFYLAVRSILVKLTRGNAPDTAQMNARVREMIQEALRADGVEEIFRLGDEQATDIFDEAYLEKIGKIKLPNTRFKVLQQLMARAIGEFKRLNRSKGIDFSERFRALVERYNERKEEDLLVGSVLEDFTDEILDLMRDLRHERESHRELGIDLEEKAFYDILKSLMIKYEFSYPEDKLLELAKAVKALVDDQAKWPDWNRREDIKAALKVDLILILARFKYPPVDRDEVYQEIFEQAENFKKHRP